MPRPPDKPRSIKTDDLAPARVISIVDDDKSFREAMARLVRSLGHSVATFDSAEQFLSSDRLQHTACLICDVRMPRMSGIQLQRELLATRRLFPVIFVTAHATGSTRAEALAAGALAFLSKPCNEDTLIAFLDQALRGPAAKE